MQGLSLKLNSIYEIKFKTTSSYSSKVSTVGWVRFFCILVNLLCFFSWLPYSKNTNVNFYFLKCTLKIIFIFKQFCMFIYFYNNSGRETP